MNIIYISQIICIIAPCLLRQYWLRQEMAKRDERNKQGEKNQNCVGK